MKTILYIIFACLGATACQTSKIKSLSATEIMSKAHEAAGGDFWKRPQTLSMFGYGTFYQGKDTFHHEKHVMYRQFESQKRDAHKASGKVRIESYRDNQAIILLAYDGNHTYDQHGKQEKSEAVKRWASNFGYGVIRHVFDKGYQLDLFGTDHVHGFNTHTIKVTDPVGSETFFDIRRDTYEIVKVAFDTPRGWHHRLYSSFFQKPEYSWKQASKVELFYDNKKTNEIIWTDFHVNEKLPDSLFILDD